MGYRATTVPVMRPPFDALDKGAKRIAKGSDGSELVPADMTYDEWLKTQPAQFQNDAIGPRRAELLRNGGLSAKQFSELNLGRNFQPLTLEEMKRVEPGAFERAGVMMAKNGVTSGGGVSDKKDLHFGGESGILDKGGDSVFKQIEGEHSVQQDLAAVNPNYGTGAKEYTHNCTNCVVAYELRQQGFDVEALPGSTMATDELAGMFDGATIQYAASLSTTDVISEMIPKVEKDVLKWGEGARGAIRGEWAVDVRGHIFSLEVHNGTVKYYDGQIGQGEVKHLESMKPQSIKYVRLDNLKPNANVIKVVKNRGS